MKTRHLWGLTSPCGSASSPKPTSPTFRLLGRNTCWPLQDAPEWTDQKEVTERVAVWIASRQNDATIRPIDCMNTPNRPRPLNTNWPVTYQSPFILEWFYSAVFVSLCWLSDTWFREKSAFFFFIKLQPCSVQISDVLGKPQDVPLFSEDRACDVGLV